MPVPTLSGDLAEASRDPAGSGSRVSGTQWRVCIGVASSVIAVEETRKFIVRRMIAAEEGVTT